MYYERSLSTNEALFVSRAQQKIAELGYELSQELDRNDVNSENAQLILELQYAIDSLKSTFLDWTEDEIGLVIDYYTLRAELSVFAFRSIVFEPSTSFGSTIYATVSQLNAVDQALRAQDAAQDTANQTERDRIEQESIDRDNALSALLGTPALESDLTSAIKLGGVDKDQVFVAGTTIEAVLTELLSLGAEISNFTHNTYTALVEVGSPVTVTTFTWAIQDTPTGLKISDSEGNLTNVPVTGTGYTPGSPIVYPMATVKTVTWTIVGDNVDTINLLTKSVYKSYYGKKVVTSDAPITVSEADILAGTSQLAETNVSVTVSANTTANEMGWIAVPKGQTAGQYTTWFVDTMNTATIGSGEFIDAPVEVVAGGITYEVYRWNYRSPLTDPLTLSK